MKIKDFCIADQYIIWLDDHCAARALVDRDVTGIADLDMQDIVNASLLGAAKASGFGKRKRRKK